MLLADASVFAQYAGLHFTLVSQLDVIPCF